MANVLKKKWKSLVPLAALIIIVLVLLRNNYYAQVLVNIASYSIVVSTVIYKIAVLFNSIRLQIYPALIYPA